MKIGNVAILLKLSEVVRNGPLWKVKNEEKLIQQITKLINGMKELNLAERHNIEDALFHQSNLQKRYDLIGNWRLIKFSERNIDKKFTQNKNGKKIVDFLNKELRIKGNSDG